MYTDDIHLSSPPHLHWALTPILPSIPACWWLVMPPKPQMCSIPSQWVLFSIGYYFLLTYSMHRWCPSQCYSMAVFHRSQLFKLFFFWLYYVAFRDLEHTQTMPTTLIWSLSHRLVVDDIEHRKGEWGSSVWVKCSITAVMRMVESSQTFGIFGMSLNGKLASVLTPGFSSY